MKNAAGEVVELRCTYDPATRGGNTPPDGRKVKATLHWVSAADSVPAEVRIVNPLFTSPTPNVADFAAELNPNSLETLRRTHRAGGGRGDRCVARCSSSGWAISSTTPSSTAARPVFNRTVGLRDTYAKAAGS